jgi:polyisoprenoid-binding protein YceI
LHSLRTGSPLMVLIHHRGLDGLPLPFHSDTVAWRMAVGANAPDRRATIPPSDPQPKEHRMPLRVTAAAAVLLSSVATFCHAADAVPIQAGAATLTPQNSKIQFVCAHVGPRPDPRKGGFGKFSGKAQIDAAAKTIKSLEVEIETASLFTEFDMLTNHLKSPDFFEVRRHPTASFVSTKIEPGTLTKITGKLTLHGVTKEISFPVTYEVTDSGLTLKSEFTLDRSEFGMNFDPKKVENKVSLTVVVGEKS